MKHCEKQDCLNYMIFENSVTSKQNLNKLGKRVSFEGDKIKNEN